MFLLCAKTLRLTGNKTDNNPFGGLYVLCIPTYLYLTGNKTDKNHFGWLYVLCLTTYNLKYMY